MRRVILATRINDDGERVMQIIAEVFEQPGFPQQCAANAERYGRKFKVQAGRVIEHYGLDPKDWFHG
jgi:hypothetical protein